ncbi:MAG TPA: ClpXP protease specificity-enhancing factor SspB [Alphaproteobacteria bacterium]|nr:ClpXP protease specificity-enhancing factor SspB [Alphaproteobacteria bacterium]
MTQDDDDILRYDRMVETALRGVVREAVQEVIDHGLAGEHHFYITFLTDYPGVQIPGYLRERYPGEMTIVLQYQFSDLKVDAEKMSVVLSFNNVPEKLVIPLNAISIFADPSVNFALQFQPISDDDAFDALDALDDDDDGGPDGKGPKGGGGDKSGEVISLDKFRKK